MELGPVGVFLAWQTFLVAAIVSACTSGTKLVLDAVLGGTEERKRNHWVQKLVMPALPLIFGMAAGVLLPVHPEGIVAYAQSRGVPMWSVGGAWGFVVGMFADYLYQRVKKTVAPVKTGR